MQEKKKSRKKVVVSASIALVLVGGAAFAYWTMRGDGLGTVSTKSDKQALLIAQDAPSAVAPGETIKLTGTLRNPNTTSVRLGVLSPTITSAGNANIKDFTLAGKSVTDGTLIAGGATIRWSGLTLEYKDSETENQDSGTGATVSLAYALSQYTAPTAGYNAIPAHVDGNVPSIGFQAQSVNEFGDAVKLSGTERTVNSMSVLFSSWGCQTGGGITCDTTPGATFPVPVTFSVYASDAAGTLLNPSAPLSQKTETINFAYRPSASDKCLGDDAGKIFNTKNSRCENGATQLVTMMMPKTSTLTDNVVWTVKYNTQHKGFAPTGEAGGWNSLNVGVQSFPGAPFSGADLDEGTIYVDSTYAKSTGWTGLRPLGAITTK